MKKKVFFISSGVVALAITSTVLVARANNAFTLVRSSNNNYWNHYAQVDPTENTHGSKEFWANCSSFSYTLTAPAPGEDVREGVAFNTTTYFNELTINDERYIPSLNEPQYTITFNSMGGSPVASITDYVGKFIEEPAKPTRENYRFTGWSYNQNGSNQVIWPITLSNNITLFAQWNEKVDIKGYLSSLLDILDQDPYGYIPEEMTPEYTPNHVQASEVNYDFSTFNNVSNIHYGGYGEQWHMVIENIKQSELFYNVLSIGEATIDSSIVVFNNYLDQNTEDTATYAKDETSYTASINFDGATLLYSIQFKTGLTIPFFGSVTPQIDMSYDITTSEKTAKITLTENNVMKYVVTDNEYTFALQYGVEQVSRKAFFNISKDVNDNVEGHIYEFVQLKDKDMVPACADFYIDEDYTSVVGNKASGIIGFDDYINELYLTNQGKLLGYEIMETKTISAVSVTFNTLWFNLNNISGLSNIKYIDDDHKTEEQPVGFYVNNSTVKFENKLVGGLSKKMASRRFDIEMRKQYFFSETVDGIVDHETSIPMMFIQVEQLETFNTDVASKNSYLDLNVSLSNTYLTKIQDDYDSLISTFINNKDDIDGNYISSFINN